MRKIRTFRHSLIFTLLVTMVVLNGCSVSPEPLTKEEIKQALEQDRLETYKNIEPLNKPLTLTEAIARAIKHNLNYKQKIHEAAVGLIEQRAVSYEMLPELVGNINHTARDRPGEVLSPNTTQVSLSRDKYTNTLDLQLSWSILDFGISYFNAKQKSNEYLILEEKKKTLLQEIVRDTRTAYWASQVSTNMMPQLKILSQEIDSTIMKSRQQEKEKLVEKERAAEFRISLWNKATEINKMKNNLDRSMVTLALLINVPTNNKIELNTNYNYKTNHQALPYNIREIELLALHNRPEIREEILRHRIDLQEIDKARLELIPNFTFSYGAFYDSTSFLVYNFWKQTALQLSANLLGIFNKYAKLEKANANSDLGKIRRQALAVSILTQVNIAYVRVLEAEKDNQLAQGFFDDTEVVYENLKKRSASDLASELEVFNAKVNYFDAKLKLLTSHFDKLSAYNELLDSVGYDSVNKLTNINQPLNKITKEIEQSLKTKDGFYITLDEIRKKYGTKYISKYASKVPPTLKKNAKAPQNLKLVEKKKTKELKIAQKKKSTIIQSKGKNKLNSKVALSAKKPLVVTQSKDSANAAITDNTNTHSSSSITSAPTALIAPIAPAESSTTNTVVSDKNSVNANTDSAANTGVTSTSAATENSTLSNQPMSGTAAESPVPNNQATVPGVAETSDSAQPSAPVVTDPVTDSQPGAKPQPQVDTKFLLDAPISKLKDKTQTNITKTIVKVSNQSKYRDKNNDNLMNLIL